MLIELLQTGHTDNEAILKPKEKREKHGSYHQRTDRYRRAAWAGTAEMTQYQQLKTTCEQIAAKHEIHKNKLLNLLG